MRSLGLCATVLQHILTPCPALTLSWLQLVCADVSQVQLCLLPDFEQLLTCWQAGAPPVKQRHGNARNLAAKFNNLKHFPNAIVEAEGKHIHVHTSIIGKTSQVLKSAGAVMPCTMPVESLASPTTVHAYETSPTP